MFHILPPLSVPVHILPAKDWLTTGRYTFTMSGKLGTKRGPRVTSNPTGSVQEAAELLGVSLKTAYVMARTGRLPLLPGSEKRGARKIVLMDALRRHIDQAGAAWLESPQTEGTNHQ
jgi:hypothetical protein